MSQIFDFSALVSGDDCKNFFNAALSEFKKIYKDYLLEPFWADGLKKRYLDFLHFFGVWLGGDKSILNAFVFTVNIDVFRLYLREFDKNRSSVHASIFIVGSGNYVGLNMFKDQLKSKGFLVYFDFLLNETTKIGCYDLEDFFLKLDINEFFKNKNIVKIN